MRVAERKGVYDVFGYRRNPHDERSLVSNYRQETWQHITTITAITAIFAIFAVPSRVLLSERERNVGRRQRGDRRDCRETAFSRPRLLKYRILTSQH